MRVVSFGQRAKDTRHRAGYFYTLWKELIR
jgi:hypothetical protein